MLTLIDLLGNEPLRDSTFLPAPSHYLGLEESSKTQIGTFERLYADSYQIEVGKPMAFGFNDVDFSPLVNPLGAVIEMELSASLYTALYPRLKQVIMQMQRSTDHPIKLPEPTACTIGNLLFFLKDNRFGCMPYLREYGITDTEAFMHHLESIKAGRNDSAHRVTMTKSQFLEFYQHFTVFYETFIPLLIRLKLSVNHAS